MAKKKREPDKPDSEAVEPQVQEQEGLALLKSIADSNKATAEALVNLNRRMDEQDRRIQNVAKTAAEEPKQPNMMAQAMTLLDGNGPIGKLLSALVDSFAKMPSEAPIKQGSMDEDLFAAYKESMKATWTTNSEMLRSTLESLKLDNQLKARRLTEEY